MIDDQLLEYLPILIFLGIAIVISGIFIGGSYKWDMAMLVPFALNLMSAASAALISHPTSLRLL